MFFQVDNPKQPGSNAFDRHPPRHPHGRKCDRSVAVPTGAPNKETDPSAKCQVQAHQNTIAGALVEMTLRPPLPFLALFRVLIVF